ESNGDFSKHDDTIMSNGLDMGWLAYPYSSQGSVTVAADPTVQGIAIHIVGTLKGAGSGTQTIKGQPVAIQKVNATFAITAFGRTGNGTEQTSFAPSLWYETEDNQPSYDSPIQGTTGATHSILIDYSIK